jgi:hypothetical protein
VFGSEDELSPWHVQPADDDVVVVVVVVGGMMGGVGGGVEMITGGTVGTVPAPLGQEASLQEIVSPMSKIKMTALFIY